MWEKQQHIFIVIYDDYKTAYALYIALYSILIECSEVKLCLFKKSAMRRKN